MSLKNPASFRKSIAAIGLILGPLALLGAAIVEPDTADEGAAYLADVKENIGAIETATTLYIIGFVSLIAGVVGIVHMIRRRGVVLAHIGGVLAVVGLACFVGLVTTSLYDMSLAENGARADAVKVYDGVEDYVTAYVVLAPALLGTMIGLILLGFAAWRSGLAPVWVPIVILVGFLGIMAGDGSKAITIVADVLLLAGFGFMALKLFGLTDAEWDNPETAPPAPETPVPQAVAR